MSKSTSNEQQASRRRAAKEDAQGVRAPHSKFGRPSARRRSRASSRDRRTSGKTTTRIDGPSFQPNANDLLAVHQLRKSYRKGDSEIQVLKGVSFAVRKGEFLSIVGQSGSGKSTLLHLLGTLDAPDSGEIHFDGRRIDELKPSAKDQLRNNELGMVFQFYHLLPELTMLENVLVPKMIAHSTFSYWRHRKRYVERAKHLLDLVGLSHRLKHRPNELSGGEMQRTAIARALISEPSVLFADEPTGNLDPKNGEEIIKALQTLNEQERVTTLIVTHDVQLASLTQRTIRLTNGRVEKQAG